MNISLREVARIVTQFKLPGIFTSTRNLSSIMRLNYSVRYLHNDEHTPYKYWELGQNDTKIKENYWEIKLGKDSSEIRADNSLDLMVENHEQYLDNVVTEYSENKLINSDEVDSRDPFYNKHNCDKQLTHVDSSGKAKMVDVGAKNDSHRIAMATATITLGQEAFGLLRDNKIKKGDVITVANIAGIMGAKKTCDFIPLCHNIPLSKIRLDFSLRENNCSVVITSEVKTYGKTGVEMEAIMAVSIAAITIYDMCKAVTKSMVISDVKLVHKSGGVGGDYNISM